MAAHVVNAALVAAINSLPSDIVPADGGVGSGHPVGPIDFVAEGGDIANREEQLPAGYIQSAAASWAEFDRDYLQGLTLVDRAGRPSPIFVVPGNHDASNAVGFYRSMRPTVDPTAVVAMFNRYVRPSEPVTAATYRYTANKVRYARDVGGIHFLFLDIWPDANTRAWIAADLDHVSSSTPVVIVTHDPPNGEARHFTNPNGRHDINATDRFENLLDDVLMDGSTIGAVPRLEQTEFEMFLRQHPNISAYFHGHANWNQFYEWHGPAHSITLHSFRVDSPMRGEISVVDETKLSFQLVTVDSAAYAMTVRECLWNATRDRTLPSVVWGRSTTVSLESRR